jgi:hypothetical protein
MEAIPEIRTRAGVMSMPGAAPDRSIQPRRARKDMKGLKMQWSGQKNQTPKKRHASCIFFDFVVNSCLFS